MKTGGSSLSLGQSGVGSVATLAGNATQNVMANLNGNAALLENGREQGATRSVISPAQIPLRLV